MIAMKWIVALSIFAVVTAIGVQTFAQDTEELAAGEQLYKVEFTLADATAVNALQLAIRYPIGSGRMLGLSDAVHCSLDPTFDGQVAFNHCPLAGEHGCEESGVVHVGLISLKPMNAANTRLSCEFASANGTPELDAFRVEVQDATSKTDGGYLPAQADVKLARIQALTQGAR